MRWAGLCLVIVSVPWLIMCAAFADTPAQWCALLALGLVPFFTGLWLHDMMWENENA